MTLRLILMRHAKSGWDDPLVADADRPLAPRGVDAVACMGRWLAESGYLPDAALVSSALRTRETWTGLGAPCPATVVPALYLAGPDTMLRVLRDAKGPSVLMLGHNPGITEFAQLLVAVPSTHPRFADFPTAATLVADFDAYSWSEVQFGTAHVVDFAVPRDFG